MIPTLHFTLNRNVYLYREKRSVKKSPSLHPRPTIHIHTGTEAFRAYLLVYVHIRARALSLREIQPGASACTML
jgi:hypothetical protein